jgi:hypothetical protein
LARYRASWLIAVIPEMIVCTGIAAVRQSGELHGRIAVFLKRRLDDR